MNALPTAVIFDIDGTLCDVRSIKHLVTGQPRDFTAFFPATLSCPPHHAVLAMVNQVRAAGHVVVVATARSDANRAITEQWLQLHAVNYAELFMRPGDPEHLAHDVEVKEEILSRICTRYQPVHAVEDNPMVADLWSRHGIEVTLVPGFENEIGGAPVSLTSPFQAQVAAAPTAAPAAAPVVAPAVAPVATAPAVAPVVPAPVPVVPAPVPAAGVAPVVTPGVPPVVAPARPVRF